MERFKVGDLVSVNIHNAQVTLTHLGTIEHVPNATGDSWLIRDNGSGQLLAISEGCTISSVSGARPSKLPPLETK